MTEIITFLDSKPDLWFRDYGREPLPAWQRTGVYLDFMGMDVAANESSLRLHERRRDPWQTAEEAYSFTG